MLKTGLPGVCAIQKPSKETVPLMKPLFIAISDVDTPQDLQRYPMYQCYYPCTKENLSCPQ